MIDTVILTLPTDAFGILDHDRFSPSSKGLMEAPFYPLGKNCFFKCHQNPCKDDPFYKPRLTLIRRINNGKLQTVLKIEFSIPKLLYGNNFDEVQNSSFERVIRLLHDVLYTMGVLVVPEMLRQAPVSGVHYSKNIPLTDYSTPYEILKELSKINMTTRLDLNQTDFRNEGHSLKYRTNDFELALYDKIKDLEKSKISEKRSIEKQNEIQYELFDVLKKRKAFEVLRMEIRLNSRRIIKSLFEKCQISSDFSFKSIFNSTKSKTILKYYLTELKNGYAFLGYHPSHISDLLHELKQANPKITLTKAFQVIGLKACVDEIGQRNVQAVSQMYGKRSLESVKRNQKNYKFPDGNFALFEPIEKALKEFIPLKMENYFPNLKENAIISHQKPLKGNRKS